MKNIIVNIKRESDLYEKYNDNLSKDLINYLIEEARVKDDIKIIINTNLNIKKIDVLLKEGIINAYNNSKRLDKYLDNKQIIFFIIGIIFLILSTFIKYGILNEIIIIAGWVAIWEVVDISLNIDSKLRISRKLMNKLINSEIEVIN